MPSAQGFKAKIYRLTTGSRTTWPGSGAPANLTEITNVSDCTRNQEIADIDVTTRASGGFRTSLPGLTELSYEWEMNRDRTDTHFAALEAAAEAKTSVALAFLDGPSATVGTHGMWADWYIVSFTHAEPINGVARVRVTVKPADTAVVPAFVTVA